MNLLDFLHQQCEKALYQCFPSLRSANLSSKSAVPALDITASTQKQFGHFQCNSAMKLAKVLQQSPQKIAHALAEVLRTTPAFAEVTVAGPGFINVTLSPAFLSAQVQAQARDPRLGCALTPTPKRVLIDFSSPNIAKEMHVGHLRSTILGDSLARMLAFQGHEILRRNHVGDWGTQFGMLIVQLQDTHENLQDGQGDLSRLAQLYREAKQQFDTDADFKRRAQAAVVSLQQGEPLARQCWEKLCAISRQAFDTVYQLLDIAITERGESFYQPFLAPLLKDLEQKGCLFTSDGATCIRLPGFYNREGDPLPLIVRKSDGGYNYATTDLAALRYRMEQEGAQWIIYVTDAGQSQHFEMIFAAAQQAGYWNPQTVRIDHVPFGLVLREDGKKFQTRSGETERLTDLIHTAIAQAKAAILSRQPQTPTASSTLDISAHRLGINAIKYADLSNHRCSDYRFSYERMLQFEGNTAAFLTYAYARIQSVCKKMGVPDPTEASPQLLEPYIAALTLEDPTEIALGIQLCLFENAIQLATEELLPHRLSDYLYQLAVGFHAFYHRCRVEGSPQAQSRVALCCTVGRVLNQGLRLLGLQPLDSM